MSWATTVTVPAVWTYLPDLVVAARLAAGQVPLPEMSAIRIIYAADKDNTVRIFRTTDSLSLAEGQGLLAEEVWDDVGTPGNSESLRNWFVKSSTGVEKLDVEMIN